MKTRSLLVYVPGIPFDLEAFCPQRRLAALAGSLVHEGHETQILDFGTTTGFGSMNTPGLRAFAVRAWDGEKEEWRGATTWRRLLGLRERSPWERLLDEAVEHRTAEVVTEIDALAELDLVTDQLNNLTILNDDDILFFNSHFFCKLGMAFQHA